MRRTYSLRAEMAILALVVLVWQAARIPLAGSVALSLDHAQDWLAAERAFGLSIEPSVVRFVDEHGLRHASELFYANLHDAVFFGFFAAARLLAPLRYPTLRTAFVVAHVPALAILGAYPLAPPRWLPAAPWFGEPPLHTAVLRNETAAAVSLHVGIPVLMAGFALWVWPRSPLAWLLLLYPATVFLVVLGTGNHYVLDALVGIACVAFGAGVARAVHGVAPRGSPSTSRRETAGVAVGVVLAALVANALFRGELP